jgi:cytochrome c
MTLTSNDRRMLATGILVLGAVLIAVTLPSAGSANDATSGRELFEKRCSGCHSPERDMEGPHLGGVYGRRSGTIPAFPYSDALKKAQITWNADTLDKWLTDPEQLVPNTDMAFRVEKADERTEIIRYLQQLPGK